MGRKGRDKFWRLQPDFEGPRGAHTVPAEFAFRAIRSFFDILDLDDYVS
jgi:hypothetical protein